MNRKKSFVSLVIFCLLALLIGLSDKNAGINKSLHNGYKLSKNEETHINLLSSYTIDSSWYVISPADTATTPLDDIINQKMAEGETKFYIKNGDYYLNSSIRITSPNVIIYGESKEHTQIIQLNSGNNNIEVTGSNVEVSNLTINNKNGAAAFTSRDADYVTLQDCIIYGSCNNSAVTFWGRIGVTDLDAVENKNLSDHNVIQNNIIHSNLNSSEKDGLVFLKQINGSITNNIITGNRIAFYLCRNSDVSYNSISNSDTNGIRCTVPAYDNTIMYNTIDNTLASGICVVRNDQGATPSSYRAHGFKISHNTITNSRYFGIEISNLEDDSNNPDDSIDSNTISQVDFDGIYLLYSTNLKILNNKIADVGLATATNGRNIWGWNSNLNSGIFLDYLASGSIIDSNEITNNNNACLNGIKIPSNNLNQNNVITHNTIIGYFSNPIAGNINSPDYTTISDNLILLEPENIRTASDVDNITVAWDSVTNATSYEIQVNNDIPINVGTDLAYDAKGLTSNTDYTFKIRAKLNDKVGPWSNTTTATTLMSAPTNINTEPTTDSIKISWDSVPGATSYKIQIDNGTPVDIGNNTSYTHTGLDSNTNHTYKVCAVGGIWSNDIPSTTLLFAPTNINTISDVSNIYLSWNPVTNATQYEIEINGVILNVGTDTHYSHTGLDSNTAYKYRVRAVDGTWSSVFTANTLLLAPTNINTEPTTNTIKVSWDSVPGATSYKIQIDNGTPVDIGNNTSYTHTGLDSNTNHTYKVCAVGGIWSNDIPSTTLLFAPTNINTISDVSNIYLSWNPVTNATQYEIEINGVILNVGTDTHYSHTGLDSNTAYKYRVRAVDGTWSSVFTANTLLLAPTNINTEPTIDSIKVSWDSVPGATSYKIQIDNGTPVDIGNNTSYTHTGLDSNTNHTYKVCAVGGIWSNDISGTTLSPPPPPDPVVIPAPTNIVAIATVNSIKVSWNSVINATGYEIEVNGVILNVGTDTHYSHTGLDSNTTYKYRVRAIGGTWSSIITATTLPPPPPPDPVVIPAPTNITAIATVNSIKVSWNSVINATGYEIEVNGVILNVGTDTHYSHTGLDSNTTYKYRVRAIGGTWSSIITATTLPPPPPPDPVVIPAPTNITAIATVNSIKVSWNSVANTTGYEIEVNGVILNVGTDTHYSHTGLDSNTTYKYRIRAIGGTWSSIITATTLVPTPKPKPTPAIVPSKSNPLPTIKPNITTKQPIPTKRTYYTLKKHSDNITSNLGKSENTLDIVKENSKISDKKDLEKKNSTKDVIKNTTLGYSKKLIIIVLTLFTSSLVASIIIKRFKHKK
ncbi:fibronectin type III domain-containing protein [Inconstantimicrobium mannanitabidum]|uniref:Uncharacterized protein n=1 Tax=Inconstantimicrobium mannanitabidum TaxID=1604901 RepID=A0ACB5RHJ1_9CLOT|nr:right-handed parallel beta-helix repeat-containing protein [Clostridium sp. TW13]GKX68552.1 hypothetical protein rsdtw13_38100 [Clostridium sp. TW13]